MLLFLSISRNYSDSHSRPPTTQNKITHRCSAIYGVLELGVKLVDVPTISLSFVHDPFFNTLHACLNAVMTIIYPPSGKLGRTWAFFLCFPRLHSGDQKSPTLSPLFHVGSVSSVSTMFDPVSFLQFPFFLCCSPLETQNRGFASRWHWSFNNLFSYL